MIQALLIFISIISGRIAQQDSPTPPFVYYIEVESEDSTDYQAIYGDFSINSDDRVEKQEALDIDEDEFFSTLEKNLKSLPRKKRNILIFIHGMWAHRDFFQEEQLSRMRQDVLKNGDSPYGMVVSLIWHSGMNYHYNVTHSRSVGKYYSHHISRLLDIEADNFSVMAHSMGNRVFQGVLDEISEEECTDPLFDKMLFIAADLEEDIFAADKPLSDIDRYVRQPIVYVHNNDRSLGLSRALNENDRLGLNANAETLEDNPSITIIDVSTVNDNDGFGPSLSNHRYFYTSPSVRNDLYYSLHGLENPLRIPLKSDRRFKLSMKESTE